MDILAQLKRVAPWLLGGTSLAAIVYAILRRVSPGGAPLIIYASAGSGAGEFRTVAERLAAQHNGARVVGVTSPSMVRAALSNSDEPIAPLLLVGHGTSRRFFSNFGGGVAPSDLAQWLRGRLAPTAVIGLVGCRAGADTNEADWTSASYGPGGSSGFAGQLRDALVAQGVPWGVQVRAHSTAGHASSNPAVRVFVASRSMVGTPGMAVIDLKYGEGAWRNLPLRQEWVQWFQGERAERYIGGGELP